MNAAHPLVNPDDKNETDKSIVTKDAAAELATKITDYLIQKQDTPPSDSILNNSSLKNKLSNIKSDNNYLSMALLKAELEYKDILSIITLQDEESLSYMLNPSKDKENWTLQRNKIYTCIPFFRKDFEITCNDLKTGCACPDGFVPCSNKKALLSAPHWKSKISDYCQSKEDGDVIIVGKNFNTYNCDGFQVSDESSTKNEAQSTQLTETCKICNDADVILCRRIEPICEASQWSEWSGCSKPCGPGTQTRFRIFLNDKCEGESNKESRNCQLGECPDRVPHVECKFMTLPTDRTSAEGLFNHTDYSCFCHKRGHVACTPEEAMASEDHWKDDFLSKKDEYINSLKLKGLIPPDLDEDRQRHLDSTFKTLLSGGVFLDGSLSWSIGSEFNIYCFCKPGAPVLCKEISAFDNYQTSSFAQYAYVAEDESYIKDIFTKQIPLTIVGGIVVGGLFLIGRQIYRLFKRIFPDD